MTIERPKNEKWAHNKIFFFINLLAAERQNTNLIFSIE